MAFPVSVSPYVEFAATCLSSDCEWHEIGFSSQDEAQRAADNHRADHFRRYREEQERLEAAERVIAPDANLDNLGD